MLTSPAFAQNAPKVTPLRRVALLISSADGGDGRATLRYAQSDTSAVRNVLIELAGLSENDVISVHEPTTEELATKLSEITQILRVASSQRREFLIYYSGHSDEYGLLLQGKHFAYKDLRKAIKEAPANVRIAILDSCSSGAIARAKGGRKRRPVFTDEKSEVKGLAFLTSSSEDEAAQESDRIGGSYFTHFLVSGLRGAADNNNDGRVTLDEAYQFAFKETLANTVSTLAGPQHPAYDIQLTGRGELVLTQVKDHTSNLVLEKDFSGRLFLYDGAGNLAIELTKPQNQQLKLALSPSKYRAILQANQVNMEAQVSLSKGSTSSLKLGDFLPISVESTTIRGKAKKPPVKYKNQILHFGFIDQPRKKQATDPHYMSHLSLALVHGEIDAVAGVASSLVSHRINGPLDGIQQTLVYSEAKKATGIQLSLGINKLHDSLLGIQASLLYNHVGNMTEGLQLSLGGNRTKVLKGGQFTLGANAAEIMHGVQSSLGINLANKDVKGVQLTLGLNISSPSSLASLVQASIVANYAEKIQGIQASVAAQYCIKLYEWPSNIKWL